MNLFFPCSVLLRGEDLAGWLFLLSHSLLAACAVLTPRVFLPLIYIFTAPLASAWVTGVYHAPIACGNEMYVDFSWRELCLSCKYAYVVSTCEERSQLSSCKVTCRVRAAGGGLHKPCSGLLSASLGNARCPAATDSVRAWLGKLLV